MKNFRKVLALVLVVATLFSFTAMTSAAYEDADKISYTQAVDVLSAVGVLNGYEVAEDEFEFHPTDKITREEMAKMIAVMCNAGDDVSTLYASACNFADVAKTRWSASYVAYCAKTGIVAGRSATTFDPTANVTGLETAKMLLVALGFDPSTQGYTGADWKINVLRDAKAAGLLGGFAKGYDIEVAITREEAAQMMLNALMGKVVIGHLSDAAKIVVTNKAYADWNGTAWTLIDAKGAAKLYGKVVISDTTLWEALYGGNLETVTDARDCFGRPSAGWKWTNAKGKVTYSGVYPVAAKWTSNDTTYAAVEKELLSYKNRMETINFFVDGELVNWSVADDKIGHGTQVEIYAYDVVATAATATTPATYKTQLDVVIINTYVGAVDCANSANGTVAIELADGSKKSIANTYGYGVADEGKVVSYTICSADINEAYVAQIHAIEELTAEVVTLHAIRKTLGEFCDTAENVYEPNFTATGVLDFVDANLAKQVKIYTDANGFVLKVANVAATKNVAVLVAESGRKSTHSVDNYDNDYFAYTAKFVEFAAAPKASDALAVTAAMYAKEDNLKYDLLLKWTDDGYGKRDVANADIAATATGSDYQLKAESGQIVGLGLVGTESTQYILRLYNASTGAYEYKYFDGCDEIDANYVLNNLQYFTSSANHYGARTLTYVYADASKVKSTSIAFVLSFATSEKYKEVGGAEVEYKLFNAIVNGEEAYVAYDYADLNYTTTKALTDAVNATTAAGKIVNKAVKSDYYKVIVSTHDDKPVYIATSIAATTEGKDFLVIGDLLTYLANNPGNTLTSKPLAEGAEIIVIADYATNNAKGYTDEIVVLDDYADLELYLTAHGWNGNGGYAYIQTNAAGQVAYLYLYVVEG